jgi:hypothetical protein
MNDLIYNTNNLIYNMNDLIYNTNDLIFLSRLEKHKCQVIATIQ